MIPQLSAELEARAQELATRIAARSAADIRDMARRLLTTTDATLFGDTEFALRYSALGLVAHAYIEHLPQKRVRHLRPRMPPLRTPRRLPLVPGQDPRNARRRGRVPPLVLPLRLLRTRLVPVGPTVGLTDQRLSLAVERFATLCGGVADTFEKGTELLRETAGVRLSESTVQRATEATGHRIAKHLRAGRSFGGRQAWDYFHDAGGRTVGDIGTDATGVRQQ